MFRDGGVILLHDIVEPSVEYLGQGFCDFGIINGYVMSFQRIVLQVVEAVRPKGGDGGVEPFLPA